MDSDWIQEQFETLRQELRKPREEELRQLGRKPHKGKRLVDVLARDHGISILGEIQAGQPQTLDSVRKYVNVGLDGILISDTQAEGMEDVWSIIDFLERRTFPIPALQNTRILHPHQILVAAETGFRAVMICPEALPKEAIDDLHYASMIAGLDTVFEIENEEHLEAILPLNPQIIAINMDSTSDTHAMIAEIPNTAYAIAMQPIEIAGDVVEVYEHGADAIIVEQPNLEEEALEYFISAIREEAI